MYTYLKYKISPKIMANGCHYLIHVIVSELTFTVKEYIITYVMFICYECVYHVIKLVLGNQLDKDAETEEIKTYFPYSS